MRASRLAVLAAAAAACGRPAPRPAPAVPPEPLVAPAASPRSCADAAAGLESATRHVRAPDASLLAAARARCAEDAWPAAAVACFAAMGPEDLERCAGELPEDARAGLLAVIGGTDDAAAALPGIVARLAALQIGVDACDRFVAAVRTLMACEGVSVEDRVALGTETLDFWALPTSKLSADARARVAAACDTSRAALAQRAVDVGCMP